MNIGIVDSVQYTIDGLGNQYTTIDGTCYMTWWNLLEHRVRPGVTVRYSVQENQRVCLAPETFADVATIHEVLR